MSKSEVQKESRPGPSDKLKDNKLTEGNDSGVTAKVKKDLEIEAKLQSYYNQSGSLQLKPAEISSPSNKDREGLG